MINAKHQRPRRRKCQLFLLAHLNPNQINTAMRTKKKVKPEKKGRPKPFTNNISNLPARITLH
jgi:hypothetical protein